MGSYTSKLFSHHEDEAKTKSRTNTICPSDLQKIKLCTPPIAKRKLANDPRSATIGIVRTPIEVTATPLAPNRRVPNALPKYLQTKRYLETDFDSVIPTTPEKFVLDPRSPNIDQQRTPITANPVDLYSSSVVTSNLISDTDNAEKVQTDASVVDPRSPATDFDRTPILKPRFASRTATSEEVSAENRSAKLSYCETTTDYSIPEIQTIAEPVSQIDESTHLETSPNVLKTFRDSTLSTGSSEETLDCSENDQQITVIRNPTASSLYSAVTSTRVENKAFGIDNDNDEEANESKDLLGETLDNENSEIVNAAVGKTIGHQKILTSNDKVKVWRDSISPSIDDGIKNVGEKVTAGESIVESDIVTITKNPKITNAVTGKIVDDASKVHMKKKKLQQQVKSGNKPLIDERENFNNEDKNPVDPSSNRTPLGNRSNNNKQRPRISAKSPQQLLRNKGLSVVQQENTPPTERFVSKTRPHGIQWDPDTTIII